MVLTLAGALPVYRRVAAESPRGSGSIHMLERLLPWWAGKLFVLVLLGFAATDFMITITLSAADASAHAIENPFAPVWLHGNQVLVTLVLITLLGAVFLRGFKDAIGVAVVLVAVYLLLNLVVVVVAIGHVAGHLVLVTDWWGALNTQHGNPLVMVGIALLVFPKLALGLSGFETGVAVMPQIHGSPKDTEENPAGRIRGTKRLLTSAAVIMSGFLISSSIVTTLLIPQKEFQAGGAANGRALAYLAHEYLGPAFGTVYDLSTICILWFAGASALAGLLNLVPRYLPRYGMAPQWARAVRPLVFVFIAIAFLITIVFQANVDAQGGAYATGVLVLITSASVAVALSARRKRQRWRTVGFSLISAIFLYTTVANVIERPEGVRIATLFIVGIMTTSIVSRIRRSFQLRATSVTLDDNALQFVTEDSDSYGVIQIVSHGPDGDDETEYRNKIRDERHYSHIPSRAPIIFLEVYPSDSSDFEEDLVPAAREILGEYVAVGAQDLSTEDAGAFTREVSGATIAEFGCSVVEVGHAERRRLFGETDDVVRAKTASALRNGLTPVLCVGEATQGIREDAVSECIRQFDDAASTGRRAGSSGGIIVAYEPLWAIGASEPASPEYIRAVFGPCGSTCAIRRGVRTLP